MNVSSTPLQTQALEDITLPSEIGKAAAKNEPLDVISSVLPLLIDSAEAPLAPEILTLVSEYAAPERITDVALAILQTAKSRGWNPSDDLQARLHGAMYRETIDLSSKLFRFMDLNMNYSSGCTSVNVAQIMQTFFQFLRHKTKHIVVTSHYEIFVPMTGSSYYGRVSWKKEIRNNPQLAEFLQVQNSPQTATFEKNPTNFAAQDPQRGEPSIAPLELCTIRMNDWIAHLRPAVLPQPIRRPAVLCTASASGSGIRYT